MTQTQSTEAAFQRATPKQYPNAAVAGGRLRRYRNTITLASQASGDTIQLTEIPAGSVFAYGVLNTDTSLGSSTIAIGNSTTAAKYKAAAVFTATDTPTLFGKQANAIADPSTANEIPLLTIGAATMPASGNLVVDMFFSAP